jgi:hypothetical protein
MDCALSGRLSSHLVSQQLLADAVSDRAKYALVEVEIDCRETLSTVLAD